MFRPRLVSSLIAVLVVAVSIVGADHPDVYRPALTPPEFLEPFLKHVEAGHDEFPEERTAEEIEARLAELSARLRADVKNARNLPGWILTKDFRGARLAEALAKAGAPAGAAKGSALDVTRATDLPSDLALDARAFGTELARLLNDIREVHVAEFIVTGIEPGAAIEPGAERQAPPLQEKRKAPALRDVRTTVRYDIVGAGTAAWRVQHVGEWRMTWRRGNAGWQVAEWTAQSHTRSAAPHPVFTEITGEVLGGTDSFNRQLGIGLDPWMATFDSVLTRDSNGHHGVSVGDADGDGLEDLYVSQPSGLPNRLYRNRGDGTFEDITEAAGVGVLDDTAMSLFADIDNDGDQDLILSTATQLLLFVNDGHGRFTFVPDAFEFARPLQGSLTSIAVADYDRDGFLDLYVCVYSYFYGAGEDKAGTPAPYYDARNGPPAVLFRNDGRGRFVDVTSEAGLDEGNDRYHFAAAWADYDGDGWVDLLVVNDFGTNNLYRNRGDGTFEDVAAKAGVLDHAAGMSAAFLDYDNDGLLDIYTGNMWSASGRRVTASLSFMPDAPADVRALYQRHARGNSLFRNRGDGTFEDTTVAAGAAFGRWAWSSDVIDFDSDGWDDLLIVNGMLSRDDRPGASDDLDGFFWRQVVARSPHTRMPGTAYDDAWRAINQLLIQRSIAGRQRNVLLRNDGRGAFDDVSGAAGLDLDQDGRSFAVLDLDGDGDPDLAIMAVRQAPQLRVFRNDFPREGASFALRLTGTKSNRDAIGAKVVIETDRLTRTRVVHAGSGFLSQHSKELLVGLGASERIGKLTVHWPSGETQVVTDVPLNARVTLTEGGKLESQPFARASTSAGSPQWAGREAPPLQKSGSSAPGTSGTPGTSGETWFYEPFPAPEFSLPDLTAGTMRSVAALKGRPALLLVWSSESTPSRQALASFAQGQAALAQAGIGALAMAVDPAERAEAVRSAVSAGVPAVHANREVALSYAIANRHLFMNRQDLRLPTTFLLDSEGRIVKAYRDRLDVSRVIDDAAAIGGSEVDRLGRAIPFSGTFYSPLPLRTYLTYGRELMDQGLESAAVAAFERAAAASPSASTLYRLGTLLAKTGDTARARAAYERALALQPNLSEASNDLGTLLAREGDLDGAIRRFREALAAAPEYPDALNNLGYALLLQGQNEEARALYERALELQPDFPEALNNLGLLYGRAGDLDRARQYFGDALARRPDYGEAANNMALVLVARGQSDEAVRLLEGLLERVPGFEAAYVTLAKIHLSAGRSREGIAVLERLLQRNAQHPVAIELLREWKGL